MLPAGIDSVIHTQSTAKSKWKNAGINLNLHHSFTSSQTLSADIDYLTYDIHGHQAFQNNLAGPGGYEEAFKGDLPSKIKIFSVKADHTLLLSKELKLESGLKTSHITTDNIAAYFYRDGTDWKKISERPIIFYIPKIFMPLYGNIEKKADRWTLQSGLRYEFTHYRANQLGNSLQKDSAFSKNYNSFFPSASVSFEADSFEPIYAECRQAHRQAAHFKN